METMKRTLWCAVIGGVEIEYKTRSAAVTALRREVEAWIGHATMFEKALLPKLYKLLGEITSASGKSVEWEVPLPYGMTGTLGYRAP